MGSSRIAVPPPATVSRPGPVPMEPRASAESEGEGGAGLGHRMACGDLTPECRGVAMSVRVRRPGREFGFETARAGSAREFELAGE